MPDNVRIDFEARQNISKAVEEIDSSLDKLKGSLGSLASMSQVADSSTERLEDSLDEVGDEASQATVKLTGLLASLSAFEATEHTGVRIPIDVDDPSSLSLKEVRDKVAAQLRAHDPAELGLDPEVDVSELAEEIEESGAYVDAISTADKPIVDIGVDLDDDTIFEEVRGANQTVREAETSVGDIDIGINVDVDNIKAKVEAAVEEAEDAAEDIALKLDVPASSLERVERETQATTSSIEDSNISEVDIDLNYDHDSALAVQRKIKSWSERVEGYNYSTIDIKLNLDFDDLLAQQAELKTALETMEAVNEVNIDVDIDASDDVVQLVSLIGALSEAQAEAFKTAAATRTAASGIDEVGDEAAESAGELGFFATAANMASLNTTALSLNIGAFNIALGNLVTQIPILIGLLGTLGTALGGVAGAAGLAAGGFAGIFAGGFLAETQRVQEEFSNIEDRAQAMQAIMESLMQSFSEAVEPLTQAAEEADIFFRVINGLLETTNIFAQGIADSMQIAGQQLDNFIATGKNLGIIDDQMSDSEIDDQIMSLGEFFDEVGQIWEDNVADIVAAIQVMSAFLLPILTDIIDYFVSGFDEMILFVTEFTHSLQTLGPALRGVVDFAQQLIELTSAVLQGIVPVLVGLISVGTEVARMFNSLDSQIISNIAAIALMAKVVGGLYGILGMATGAVWQLVLGLASEKLAHQLNSIAAARSKTSLSTLTAVKRALTVTSIALRNALSKEAIMRWANNSSIIGALASLWSMVTAKYASAAASYAEAGGLWAAVSGLSGYSIAASAAAVASWALAAPLLPIVAALAAIAVAGALVVGVLGNMESVTAGLKGALQSIKEGLTMILDVLLGVFIDVWNSLMEVWAGIMAIVNPLADAFGSVAEALGFASDEGGGMSAMWSILAAAIKAVFLPIQLLFDILGKVAWLIGTVLGAAIGLLIDYISWWINLWISLGKAIVDGAVALGSAISNFFKLGGAIESTGGLVEWLRSVWTQMEEILMNPFKSAIDGIEWFVNESIRALNRLIEHANKIPGVNIDKVDYEMDLSQPEDVGGKMTKEDVVQNDAEDAENEVARKQPTNFNYNEENVNEVAQEINADPEDKESMRRVVTDAMEEANAFARRNQGHGG